MRGRQSRRRSDEAARCSRRRRRRHRAPAFSGLWLSALLDRTFEAARWLECAQRRDCRRRLRQQPACAPKPKRAASRYGIPVFIPPLALSTDNAAMIGAAGLRRFRSAGPGSLDFNAEAGLRWSIASVASASSQPSILRTSSYQERPASWKLELPSRTWTNLESELIPMSETTVFTDYLWFNTKSPQEFVRITDEVAAIVKKSGVTDGIALVSAMHITSGVYVNDWEDGLIHDFQVWLEKLAPAGLPYKHHQTGEDNADAHLKRTIMGHQVIVPITGGTLDLGPWEQIFYAEFDGQRQEAGGREGDGDW